MVESNNKCYKSELEFYMVFVCDFELLGWQIVLSLMSMPVYVAYIMALIPLLAVVSATNIDVPVECYYPNESIFSINSDISS